MATILEFIRRSYANRAQRKHDAELHKHPLDVGLPLGLHIDGKIDIHPLVPQNGLLMTVPGKTHLVQAFSRGTINGTNCFKVFLHSDTDDTLSYLWIFQDGKGVAVRWFVSFDEVIPENQEQWAFWLNKKDGSIGYPAFQTNEAQGNIQFGRLWEPKNPRHINPVPYTERVFPDRYDLEKQFTVECQCMLYGREVQDPICTCNELILLSDVSDPEGKHIAIDVGIDLNPVADITVVY